MFVLNSTKVVLGLVDIKNPHKEQGCIPGIAINPKHCGLIDA